MKKRMATKENKDQVIMLRVSAYEKECMRLASFGNLSPWLRRLAMAEFQKNEPHLRKRAAARKRNLTRIARELKAAGFASKKGGKR